MTHTPKVLVIPSWYPNKELTSDGSQFREQSEFFLKRFDMRVLFGSKSELPLVKWVLQYRLKHAGPLEQETTQAGLIEYRFEYKPWYENERHQTGAMIEGYRQSLDEIISSGWKPDIIHARCIDPAGIAASKLASILDIPWVLSEHQHIALGNYSEYRGRLLRKTLKLASTVTVVSQHQLRSLAIQYKYPHMIVTGNLIDEEKFPLTLTNKNSTLFKILTVMFVSPIKDPDTFFRAISILVQKGHRDIEVTVIGKKLSSIDDTSEFQNLAQKYQVKEFCRFLPNVPREEMPALLAETDVFVSTSLVETFGLAVREAMSIGKPVVCTASGGVDDDIFDFNGFKVDIYDAEAISSALAKIKNGNVSYDPAKISKYITAKYGRQAYLNRFIDIFNEAIQN